MEKSLHTRTSHRGDNTKKLKLTSSEKEKRHGALLS